MLKTSDDQIVYFGLVLPKDLNFKKRPADLDGWKSYGRHLSDASRAIEDDRWKANKENAEKTEYLPEHENMLAWALGDWLVEGIKGGLKPRTLKGHLHCSFGEGQP